MNSIYFSKGISHTFVLPKLIEFGDVGINIVSEHSSTMLDRYQSFHQLTPSQKLIVRAKFRGSPNDLFFEQKRSNNRYRGGEVAEWHIDGDFGKRMRIMTSAASTSFAGLHLFIPREVISDKYPSALNVLSPFEAFYRKCSVISSVLHEISQLHGLEWLEQVDDHHTFEDGIKVSGVIIMQAEPFQIAAGWVNKTLHRSSVASADDPESRLFIRNYHVLP